jgi:hypothetical protein
MMFEQEQQQMSPFKCLTFHCRSIIRISYPNIASSCQQQWTRSTTTGKVVLMLMMQRPTQSTKMHQLVVLLLASYLAQAALNGEVMLSS